jgi:hypothetical protein
MSDRRAHKRFSIVRPGKIFRRSTQSFCAAVSEDLSFAGARLHVRSSRPLHIGEVLEVGIALTSSAVVPESSMLRAIVVRSSPTPDGLSQSVAVRYLHREACLAKVA